MSLLFYPQKSQRQASAEAYFGDVRGQRYEKVWKVILFWLKKLRKELKSFRY